MLREEVAALKTMKPYYLFLILMIDHLWGSRLKQRVIYLSLKKYFFVLLIN